MKNETKPTHLQEQSKVMRFKDMATYRAWQSREQARNRTQARVRSAHRKGGI